MSGYNIRWIWDAQCSPTEKLVLFALNEHCNAGHGDWRVWPNVKTLTRLTGMSDRTIRTHIASLASQGLITVCEQRRPDGTQRSNLIYLNAPWIADQTANSAVCYQTANSAGYPANSAGHEPLNRTLLNLSLPDAIDQQAWEEWSEYRKSVRKPISPKAATKQWALLAEYTPDQQRRMVGESIKNDWAGLFPPKGDGPPRGASPTTRGRTLAEDLTDRSWATGGGA
jgi:hypothetical protein